MITITDIEKSRTDFVNKFRKSIQSANINFIIGSGCSYPYLKPLGDIEKQIMDKIEKKQFEEADRQLLTFLSPFVDFMNTINDKRYNSDFSSTLKNYNNFISNIAKILFQRKNNLLHKQASVFTTNYDLFFELAYQDYSGNFILNDGFRRRPSIGNDVVFSISEYFNTVYNIGNMYNYQVEIPSINLIKLHGSLNWGINGNTIINSTDYIEMAKKLIKSTNSNEVNDFINLFTLVLPKKDKFRETLINQTYYDLLRIFANELDKENTILISEGFSFFDEHIFEIVKRSLRNPTLKLIIFCYSKDDKEILSNKFNGNNNVEIIFSSTEFIKFEHFNNILFDILPNYLREDEIIDKGIL